MARIPNSCLVCAFPAETGIGRSARNLFRLGFFDQAVFLKFDRRDPEVGYQRVVHSRWSALGGVGALASQYLPSRWREEVRKFDFVHFQSPHFFHLASAPKAATGTVHDTFFFDSPAGREYPWGARVYFRKEFASLPSMRGVVTDSASTERDVHAASPGSRTQVVHLWTDSTFVPRDRAEARRTLGLPSDKVILLSVGSENRLKNVDLLPPILNELGSRFLLVRVGPSGSILPRFKERVVTVPFETDDRYPHYFNAADIVLMPSLNEGFGYPLIEAVNSGTPVLASNIPVFQELLGADYPYLLHPDRPQEWVTAARAVAELGSSPEHPFSWYRRWDDYYREARGRQEFEAFFRSAGVL